ncbi:MAG: M61 family metallopeptidase, partial [Acidobacteriota bacterium]
MTRAPYLVVVAILVAATAPSSAQPAAATVSYRFTYAQPDDATAVVEIGWSTANPERRTLIMPRAIPMGYGEQRYDAFVKDLRAWSAEGAETSPQRDEGPRWRLGPNTVRVRYRVDLREMEREVRAASDASRVRDGYLGALGYSVFAYVEGDETRPTHLRLEGPAGWPVYSTLAPRWPVTSTSIDATAPDYYALADSQIVMGPRAVFRRLSEKPAPLYLASYAEGPVDLDGVGRLALTAYERVLAYFGTVPFAHYSVHQELLTPISPRHEYGMSMEHLDSSTYYLAASSGLTSSSTEQDELRVL